MRYNPIPYDHLVIPQGATFETSWYADDADTGEPPVWTGWTARMQIRDSTSGDLIATLATNGPRDGNIALTSGGNIVATLPATFTAALTPGQGVFDLKFTDPNGAVWRAVEGAVAITPEVTSA